MVRAAVVIRRGGELIHVNDVAMAERHLAQNVDGSLDSCIGVLAKRALGLLEEATGSKHKGIGAAVGCLRKTRRFGKEDASMARSLRSLQEAHSFVRHLTDVGIEAWAASLRTALGRLETLDLDMDSKDQVAPTVGSDMATSKKKKKKPKRGGAPSVLNGELADTGGGGSASGAALALTSPTAAVSVVKPGRKLAAHSSRERSPRRGESPAGATCVTQLYEDGSQVVIASLHSRPELVSSSARVLSFDPVSGRYALSIAGTKEQLRILGTNLQPGVFTSR